MKHIFDGGEAMVKSIINLQLENQGLQGKGRELAMKNIRLAMISLNLREARGAQSPTLLPTILTQNSLPYPGFRECNHNCLLIPRICFNPGLICFWITYILGDLYRDFQLQASTGKGYFKLEIRVTIKLQHVDSADAKDQK